MAFDPNTAKASFDPSTASLDQVSLKDTVAQQVDDPNSDQESIERVKTTNYLQQKGYDVSLDTVDNWRTQLFSKDSSWGAINKQLTNELSVEPLGPVRATARTKPFEFNEEFVNKTGRFVFNINDEEGLALLKSKAPSFLKTVKESSPIFKSFWSRLKGVGQSMPEIIAMMPEAIESAFMEYGLGGGETPRAEYLREEMSDISSSFDGMRALAASNFKDSAAFAEEYKGPFRQGYIDSIKTGNMFAFGETLAKDVALEMPNFVTMIGLSFINPSLGLTYAGTSTGAERYTTGVEEGEEPSEAMGTAMIHAAAEVVFERASTVGLVKKAKAGELKKGFVEGLKTFARGGGSEAATTLTQDLADGEFSAENVVASFFAGGVMDVGGGMALSGFNGGPFTTDDISTLRQQPEKMNNLDSSEESDLLKRAVNENDGSAHAELNQRMAGIADIEVGDDGVTLDGEPVDTTRLAEDFSGSEVADGPTLEEIEETLPKAIESATTPAEISDAAEAILAKGKAVTEFIERGTSLTTRLRGVSPELSMRMRKMESETHEFMSERTERTQEFVESWNELTDDMTKEEINDVSALLRKGDFDSLEQLGIKGVEDIRALFSERAEALGIEETQDYFPSKVSDYKALTKHLGTKQKSAFESAIKERERQLGRELNEEEKLSTIRNTIRKSEGGFGLSKARAIRTEDVTAEMMQFYADPIETLNEWVVKTSKAMAQSRFTGTKQVVKDGELEIGDEGIDAMLLEQVESGKLDPEAQNEAKRLIQARMNYQSSGKAIDTYRRLVSLKYVTKVKTTVKQFADIGVNVGENGLRAVLGKDADPLIKELKANVGGTLEAINVDALDMEIRETKRTAIEEMIYKPLQAADAKNKEWMVQSSARNWKMMADKNPAALEAKLTKKWGVPEFSAKVTQDLKNDILSADVKFALYMQVADFHPISPSEHARIYIENASLRPLFVLKSFQLKRFDRLYREGIRDTTIGISKVVAGAVDGNADLRADGAADIASGAVGLARFAFYAALMEATLEKGYDEVKELFGVGDDEDDEFWVNYYLKELGRIIPFVDPYDIQNAMKRADPVKALQGTVELAEFWGSDIAQSLYKTLLKDERWSDQADWLKDIPYISEFAYEKKKAKMKGRGARRTSGLE